jgi:peptide/nickel transport system substrate-binding protein
VNFRKALAYCVDYGAISKDILPDAPAPIGMVPSRIAGHNPNVEQPKFDLQEAEKWLKKSKYYKDLAKYPVELAWVAEVPDREKIALLVQANALKIGIKVNVVRVPWVSLVDRAPKPETTPNATIVSMSPDYPEAGGYMFPRWHSSGKGTWLQMDWLLDKDIDKMLEDALQIAEWDSRMQKYKAIQSKLMEIQPSVVLTQGLGRRAYQSNYVVWPHADNAKAGKPIHTVMGYSFYMPTIEVFPERIPK